MPHQSQSSHYEWFAKVMNFDTQVISIVYIQNLLFYSTVFIETSTWEYNIYTIADCAANKYKEYIININ